MDGLDFGYLRAGGWARPWLLMRGWMGSTLATFARADGLDFGYFCAGGWGLQLKEAVKEDRKYESSFKPNMEGNSCGEINTVI